MLRMYVRMCINHCSSWRSDVTTKPSKNDEQLVITAKAGTYIHTYIRKHCPILLVSLYRIVENFGEWAKQRIGEKNFGK